MNKYIEFKKQRELGEILTDTFAFVKLQFKPFTSTFFKIVGPYLVVLFIAMGFYLYSFGSLIDFNTESSNQMFKGISIFIGVMVFMVALVLVYATSQSTVLHYIKSYINNNGIINFQDIKKDVYSSFWSFIGLGVLVVISVFAGMMFCFLPGIYLAVPLALSFSILIFEGKGISDSYGYSFTLIKGEWWITFATFFVIGIIVAVAGYAFSIPTLIYQYAKMGIFSGEVDATNIMDSFIDPIYVLLNILSTMAQTLLHLLTIISGAFIYFNLNEKKNFTGTYERIQNLGEAPEN